MGSKNSKEKKTHNAVKFDSYNKKEMIQLYPYHYDGKAGKWVLSPLAKVLEKVNVNDQEEEDNDNDDDDEKKENDDQQQENNVIVMSFNVWFGEERFVERHKKLISIISEIKPDIFCFQEVTDKWLGMFIKQDIIQNNYGITDIPSDLSTIGGYGVFIGVNIHKFNILNVKICQLQSFMGRKLLSTQIQLKNTGHIFWINTVHLESKYSTETRIKQLQTIFDGYMVDMKQLNNLPLTTVMLMGDFNFRDNTDNNYLSLQSEFPENQHLKDDLFIDCWKQYANDNQLKIADGWTRRVGYRYDRILMNISSICNIHDFKILGDAENRMPSDHKGVVVYLK